MTHNPSSRNLTTHCDQKSVMKFTSKTEDSSRQGFKRLPLSQVLGQALTWPLVKALMAPRNASSGMSGAGISHDF